MDTGSSGCGVSERYSAIKLVENGIDSAAGGVTAFYGNILFVSNDL